MDSNENKMVLPEAQEALIELGVASIETKGSLGIHTEVMGFDPAAGISQE